MFALHRVLNSAFLRFKRETVTRLYCCVSSRHGSSLFRLKPGPAQYCRYGALLHSTVSNWSSPGVPDSGQTQQADFTPIYRFPYIVHFRLVCRAKLYQTGLVMGTFPVVQYLYTAGSLDAVMMYTFYGMVTLAGLMLYVMGEFFRRVIGLISVNQSGTVLRVSHLTFWGKKRDILVNATDIIPLSDMSENLNEVFVVLKTYSSNSKYFLFHRQGILNEELFWKLLG